jgi:hypothetical protein
MKTSKRPIPMDALCIEDKGYKVRMMTHHHKITVSIEKDGRLIHDEWITPEQLISLLMRDARP